MRRASNFLPAALEGICRTSSARERGKPLFFLKSLLFAVIISVLNFRIMFDLPFLKMLEASQREEKICSPRGRVQFSEVENRKTIAYTHSLLLCTDYLSSKGFERYWS